MYLIVAPTNHKPILCSIYIAIKINCLLTTLLQNVSSANNFLLNSFKSEIVFNGKPDISSCN